ncbi:MAG: hypothetical protein IJ106_04985 [Parasporobacterium sp.]|nr:hypothetical protein [Parasporobacterium sp.]
MKRRILTVLLLIIALAAAVVLICSFGGRSRSRAFAAEEKARKAEEALVYVYYADTYLSLDQNGIVCANNSSRPTALPEITGIDFSSVSFGEKAQATESNALEYVIRIALDLKKQDIRADKIAYENRMASIYIDRLEIQLGKNEKTDDKINDLADFIDKLDGQAGTLFMQNGNANNYGYTFRAK